MLTPTRTWKARQPPEDIVRELEHDLGVSALTARLLAARGVQGGTDARTYLGHRLADLHAPELMAGMADAARLFAEAIAGRKRILIHGDYDVDGSTAASLLALFARACGHEAIVFIPHRRIDGYGLGEASLAAVVEQRAELMITVDCGISDAGFGARIEAETGCVVVITDHHLPPATLPNVRAVCNPNRTDCTYPDKALAGVGVAWKLAWATAKVLSGSVETDGKVSPRLREFLLDSTALVALGTISDCAALTGENRILVHHGLLALARSGSPGLRALLVQARMDGAIEATDVGWRLGPLLNAAGRVGSAMDNITLLTATSADVAGAALAGIVSENEERKRLTLALTAELTARAAQPESAARSSLVFAGENWHQGVVGIVAGRLCEQFAKPACVIAINDGVGKGSLRTTALVPLDQALNACRAHLIKGGGHAMAAGISIEPGKVADFSAAFEAFVAARTGSAHGPHTEHDGHAQIGELDSDFFTALAGMAPFGIANPEPLLRIDDVAFVTRPRLFGATGDHVRGAVSDRGGGLRELLAWRGKDLFPGFSAQGARFDLLVRPKSETWRGAVQTRLVYVDGRTR